MAPHGLIKCNTQSHNTMKILARSKVTDYFRTHYKPANKHSRIGAGTVMSLCHVPTAATPASRERDPTLTSTPEPLKDLRTENHEGPLTEPSPTGRAERSVSLGGAEESVIRRLSGSHSGHVRVTVSTVLFNEA